MSKESEWLRRYKAGQPTPPARNPQHPDAQTAVKTTSKTVETKETPEPTKATRGFLDVAGMDSLKQLIRQGFINVLKNPERAALYGVKVPNVLLYGPAGCGKTFFAEKVAEEVGINFMKVSPDDLSSIYIHGTQQKIGEIFKKAENNAPTLIFLDEFDCMVPHRSTDPNRQHQTDEVDEFLTVLNNSADRGIYVMAATNHPENIDGSVLRTGRIDEKIYVPMPDEATRESLFRMELSRRPNADIDYARLASLTNGYNCSDITYIISTAALGKFNASVSDKTAEPCPITQTDIEQIISRTSPSVSEKDLRAIERVHEDFAPRDKQKKHSMGFR